MYLIASFHNFATIPKGATYLGDGEFDFQCKEYPHGMKERLAEFDDKKKKIFKKAKYIKKGRAEK